MSEEALKEAREQFEDAEEAWSDARKSWVDDMRFARLGEQWPDAIAKERASEGRPCLTINRLPSFIRQVVNDARLNKPQIKVHGVDDYADKETADVISDLMRQIEASSAADIAYDTALEHAVSGGFGFFRVNVAYAHDDAFEQDLRIDQIANPMSVRWDAATTTADASDWRYAFVADDMPKTDFERKYKGAEAVDWDTSDYAHLDAGWMNEDTVRVTEWWTREEVKKKIIKLSSGIIIPAEDWSRVIDGIPQSAIFQAQGINVVGERDTTGYKVRQRIITGAEVLEEIQWAGSLIPICPVYGEDITVEGKRYFISLTRQAKDAQRNFNYWRTAATELVALAPKAPFLGPKGAFNTDRRKWESANNKSHPYIEYDGPTPPQRQPFAGPALGAIQEAMNAADDMKSIMGLFDASLGAKSNETSGRAIMARQREGDVSTFHFIDNLSRGIAYAGKCLLELIPKVYNQPRMLRVIGQDNTPRAVPVNTQNAIDLTVGKYDVTVSAGPGFTTRREESNMAMIELVRANPNMGPILGDLIAKSADWPNSDEVASRLKSLLPPHILQAEKTGLPPEAQAVMAQMSQQMQQAHQQMQAMQQQLQQGAQAFQQLQQENQLLKVQNANKADELGVKRQELGLKQQETEGKTQVELAKAAASVEEARIQALADQMVARIEAAAQSMQQPLQQVHEAVTRPPQPEGDDGTSAAVQAMTMQLLAKLSAPKARSITIKAPSGGVYQAVVSDSDITVQTPAGQTMTGAVR